MAQVLLESKLGNNIKEIGSAGTAAMVGHPAAEQSQELMTERGLDLTRHRARQLTPELIIQSDLILVMETAQQKAVEAILPSARGRVHRLGKWGEFDIPDPYKASREKYMMALHLIDQGIKEWLEKVWGQ